MHTYIPILRPYDSERRLLERFAVGFEQFDQFESAAGVHDHLLPLIEVTSTDVDLVNLEGIRGDLLVDFPQYLTERSTRFDEDLEELMREYRESNVSYFRENEDRVDVPVLSAGSVDPVVYRGILDSYRQLKQDFSQIAVRPFITVNEFDDTQEKNLQELMHELRDDDLILLDIIDTANFDSQLYENLQWFIQNAGESAVFVLNAFEPQDGFLHNVGPILTQELGVNGFGDFVTDPRYPSGGGGSDEDRDSILRQYDQNAYEVESYRASTYPEALDDAQADGNFDQDHCEFCSDMDSEDRDWSMIWKVYRMGHYVTTTLEETLPEMETTNPEDLDGPGYEFLRNRVDSDEDQE